MKTRSCQLPLLLMFMLAMATRAQTPAVSDEPLVAPRVVYPDAAKAKHIEGTVGLEVHVSPDGHVIDVEALSGPEELRQAAIDAYSHATYRPMLRNGRPVPAVIGTKVSFSLRDAPLAPDEAIAAEFEPVHRQCETLSRDKDPGALAACQQAVGIAGRFTPTGHMVAHAVAYNDLALLLLSEGKIKEAAVVGDEAVTRIADVYPGSLAAANAYITRAETRAKAATTYGEIKRTMSDCAEAERILHGLIDAASAPYLATDMKAQLKGVLHLHAVLLRRNSQTSQANKLDAEADRL